MKTKHLKLILILLTLQACSPTPETAQAVDSEVKEGIIEHTDSQSKVKSEITLKEGKSNGPAKAYYPGGELWKEVNYLNGKLHGLAKVYDREGRLLRTVEYNRGIIHGQYTQYFKSGKPKLQLSYNDGVPLPGVLRRNYRGEELAEPEILFTKSKLKGTDDQYQITFSLNEKFEKVQFYILRPDEHWDSLSIGDLIYYKLDQLPGSEREFVLTHRVQPGYFLTNEADVYAVFNLDKVRQASVHRRINYAIENNGH